MNAVLKWSLFVVGLGIGFVILNRLGLWMESRGWIYWKKKSSVSSGNALGALNDVLSGKRSEIREMRLKESKNTDGSADSDA